MRLPPAVDATSKCQRKCQHNAPWIARLLTVVSAASRFSPSTTREGGAVEGYLNGSARPRTGASGSGAESSDAGQDGRPRSLPDARNRSGHGSSEEEISALRIAVRQAHTNNVSIPQCRPPADRWFEADLGCRNDCGRRRRGDGMAHQEASGVATEYVQVTVPPRAAGRSLLKGTDLRAIAAGTSRSLRNDLTRRSITNE
jgi:hypothetical protein